MSATAEKLYDQALELPEDERKALAEALQASVSSDDGDLSSAWEEEIVRRIQKIEAGEAKLFDAEKHARELGSRYGI